MARIRSIKPEFPQSESMGRVSRDARLLFIMLWTISDDSGRLRGNSRMLASLLFPYDDDANSLMGGWLSELQAEGCIDSYKVGGDSYIEIRNWLIHQKIDKPSKSKIPAFDESSRTFANPLEVSSGDLRIGSKDGIKGSKEKDTRAPRSVTVSVDQLANNYGVDKQVAADWMTVRKAKKSPLTQTALNNLITEFTAAGLTVPAGIKICVERGWVGFKPEWLKNDGGSHGTGNQGPMSAPDRVRAAIAARETGSAEGGRTLEHQ